MLRFSCSTSARNTLSYFALNTMSCVTTAKVQNLNDIHNTDFAVFDAVALIKNSRTLCVYDKSCTFVGCLNI